MDIKNNFNIDADIRTVYTAISTPEGIRGWWCQDSKIAIEEGGLHILNFLKEGKPVKMKFRVEELSPLKKIVWTCIANGNPAWINTSLIFEMDESGDFNFTHDNFDDQWAGTPPYNMTARGWNYFMNSLKSYCENGNGQPW